MVFKMLSGCFYSILLLLPLKCFIKNKYCIQHSLCLNPYNSSLAHDIYYNRATTNRAHRSGKGLWRRLKQGDKTTFIALNTQQSTIQYMGTLSSDGHVVNWCKDGWCEQTETAVLEEKLTFKKVEIRWRLTLKEEKKHIYAARAIQVSFRSNHIHINSPIKV